MSERDRVMAALDIMRRMPPNRVEQCLSGLISLCPDDIDELLQVYKCIISNDDQAVTSF